jgi:hypothetical protein
MISARENTEENKLERFLFFQYTAEDDCLVSML